MTPARSSPAWWPGASSATRISQAAGALALLAGLGVLAGWALEAEGAIRMGRDLVAMRPNTAAGLAIAGAALCAVPVASVGRWVGAAFGCLLVVLGLVSLAEYALSLEIGIDHVVFREPFFPVSRFPGRMASWTAVSFVLTGTSLVLLQVGRERVGRIADAAAGAVLLVGFLAVAGYAYAAPGLYRLVGDSPMAVHTGGTFVVLAIGLLFARGERGIAAVALERSPGGTTIRRLLVPAAALPILFGWLRLRAEHTGLYSPQMAMALIAVLWSGALGLLVLWTATSLRRSDEERRRAESATANARDSAKAMARALEERTAQLEHANRELESFTYSVSHDLRAPLRAIDGFSKILLEDHGPALSREAQRVIGVVCDNAQRMGQLIDDLLEFSRLGRQALRPQAVDMARLARQVAEELRPQDPTRAVEVDVGELPPAVCDAALIRQVWANLLGNAFKYTRTRPRAQIRAEGRADGRELLYTVRDDGVGFDMRYADKLFGVFQRLHGSSEFEGTGVGLALVQRIVVRHGGRVWAESKSGEGATFGFSLPRSGDHG